MMSFLPLFRGITRGTGGRYGVTKIPPLQGERFVGNIQKYSAIQKSHYAVLPIFPY